MKHLIKTYYMPKGLSRIPLMYRGYVFRLNKDCQTYSAKNMRTEDKIEGISLSNIDEIKQIINRRSVKKEVFKL